SGRVLFARPVQHQAAARRSDEARCVFPQHQLALDLEGALERKLEDPPMARATSHAREDARDESRMSRSRERTGPESGALPKLEGLAHRPGRGIDPCDHSVARDEHLAAWCAEPRARCHLERIEARRSDPLKERRALLSLDRLFDGPERRILEIDERLPPY